MGKTTPLNPQLLFEQTILRQADSILKDSSCVPHSECFIELGAKVQGVLM